MSTTNEDIEVHGDIYRYNEPSDTFHLATIILGKILNKCPFCQGKLDWSNYDDESREVKVGNEIVNLEEHAKCTNCNKEIVFETCIYQGCIFLSFKEYKDQFDEEILNESK